MQKHLKTSLERTVRASRRVAVLSHGTRQAVLRTLAQLLRKNERAIMSANKKDCAFARRRGRNDAFIDRLTFTDVRFREMVRQVKDISRARDVLGVVLEKRTMRNGVMLHTVSVPLGVLGVIYESRPNVTIDVASLCLMSGNACVLKGGSDSLNANRVLVRCVHAALRKHRVPVDAVNFLDTRDRRIVDELLTANEYIDVLIPRGGYGLVRSVVEKSRIPVLYHAEGGARIYIDTSADAKTALEVCLNAKTQRPATCNSVDAVLVHTGIARTFVPLLVEELEKARVEVRGDKAVCALASTRPATEADYATEFLDRVVVIKIVRDVTEAIDFIGSYGKKHTEGVIAQNKRAIETFVRGVDAAGIFVNCSTRLHDGGVFGLGAEMGVATGKLHARGPVGLRELTTYKRVAYGRGQMRE
jgi:glutamate-5-semialdehyde dehydrogenase